MKKTKVIFINSRSYGREFHDESDKFFYLFGVGHFLAWELLKCYPDILVENWRADRTISQDLAKDVDGIHCRVFKGRKTRFLGTYSDSLIRALRNEAKQNDQYTLVHFHGLHNLGYDLISWLIPRVPIVGTHHGGGNFRFKYQQKKKLVSFFGEFLDRMSMKYRFGHVFIQTVTEYNYHLSFMGRERVSRFTPFGFDLEIFNRRNKIECRKKLGLSENSKIILSVGRADHLKGVQHVVNIYHELKKETPELELVCVDVQPGDLYYDFVLQSGAKVLGNVFYYDLPDYYSASDVLVYLPFDKESLNFAGPGFVNAEALACGLPVVSSLLLHFWDHSIHEVARVPADYEEAVSMTRELLNSPPAAEECRKVAYKFFNWEYVMNHHLEVYRDLNLKHYGTEGIFKK